MDIVKGKTFGEASTELADLKVYDLGNGFLRVTGTVVDESGHPQAIDYDQLPKFMLGAVFDAARKAGALA